MANRHFRARFWPKSAQNRIFAQNRDYPKNTRETFSRVWSVRIAQKLGQMYFWRLPRLLQRLFVKILKIWLILIQFDPVWVILTLSEAILGRNRYFSKYTLNYSSPPPLHLSAIWRFVGYCPLMENTLLSCRFCLQGSATPLASVVCSISAQLSPCSLVLCSSNCIIRRNAISIIQERTGYGRCFIQL